MKLGDHIGYDAIEEWIDKQDEDEYWHKVDETGNSIGTAVIVLGNNQDANVILIMTGWKESLGGIYKVVYSDFSDPAV